MFFFISTANTFRTVFVLNDIMKLLFLTFYFALSICQELPSVTQDLNDAQAELTIGHEFAEIFLVQNRNRLSAHLDTLERGVLDSFLEAYAQIKTVGAATREAMDEFEESTCKDMIRARWELQVTRYGQKLSQCLSITTGYVNLSLKV